ncbi:hypothetical protein B0H16DRAFT_1688232 [Mycena metata]|uniref:Uncharacterized protein n=1 Tax=Mycena metata TaxID=1033252 RepID=A0AAD7JCM6_9AGAR|nr:hypothetical protein B0H16DRAFT_1688232 [Mycena metata]
MFKLGYVPIVLFSVGIGLKLYSLAFVEPPMGPFIDECRKSCTYSETNPFHDFICVVEPFFKDLITNDIGKSLFTAFGMSGTVFSTSLYIKGGEGRGSALFSPLILVANGLAGQALGVGIVAGPIVLPTLLAISKTLAPANGPAPSPPTYSYTVTLLAAQFGVFLLSMTVSSIAVTNPNWPYVNYAFQAFPLLFLSLALHPRSTPHKDTPTPTLTVSTFTVFKYLYAPLWWVTVAPGLNAYFRAGETFSLPSYFMALSFAGYVLTFLAFYALDFVAGEAQAVMGVSRLVVGLLVAGPTSTMATYFERKQRLSVDRAEAERIKLKYGPQYGSLKGIQRLEKKISPTKVFFLGVGRPPPPPPRGKLPFWAPKRGPFAIFFRASSLYILPASIPMFRSRKVKMSFEN